MKVFVLVCRSECWTEIIGVFESQSFAQKVLNSIPRYGASPDGYYILEKELLVENRS